VEHPRGAGQASLQAMRRIAKIDFKFDRQSGLGERRRGGRDVREPPA
jgi:hypothetical protein